jgi:hypothetical protein
MSNRILFISDDSYPDYMSDIVFHGLRSIFKEDLIDAKRIDFMYDDYKNKNYIYGKGFTLYGKLDSKLQVDRDKIEEKIKNKYFKMIIYGSCWRKLDYLELVKKNYNKNEIIFIDGEDYNDINFEVIDSGFYFKRELIQSHNKIHPIQFAIPEKNIIKHKPKKIKNFGSLIPYEKKTYVFNDEKSYYEDYANSFFGITCKKEGWDCLRHYEIMMNYCFPFFKDLENCPKTTMVKFPKKIIIKAMNDISKNKFDYYDECMEEIMDNLVSKLTTEKIVQYLLEVTI